MLIMNKLKYIALGLTALLISSCGGTKGDKSGGDSESVEVDSLSMVVPTYAQGFNVKYVKDMILLDIHDPENQELEKFHFALTDKSYTGEIPEDYTRINIPINSAICMTSLQLSNFIKLDITDKVVGITSTRHLRNSKVNAQLKDGRTHKIGIEGNFDTEVIMALNPDVILISPFKRGGYDAIRNANILMMPHLGYKELSPLGQAEWIKVVGLLTGNVEKANQIFGTIEAKYNELKAMVDTVSVRPTIFSGEMRSGNWYAVGGKSFLAQLFRDAGGDYFLKDNEESGGVTLDYETVYANAAHSDYWRIVNSYDGEFSYEVLGQQDKRYTDFDAWKKHGVIYCNMNTTAFYESMPVEPEVILADFIHVLHPNILPDHKPRYYHLLEK
jgi:iron complex transport system substrate-binding protein